jgi:thymidylate kinase
VSRYLLSWLDRDRRPEFLAVHVRSDYLRCGRRLWKAAELLKDRVRASELSQERCDVFAAPAAKEFARCLIECIDRDQLTQRDGEHLARQWRLDPAGAAQQVARFWDVGREGGIVLRAAVADHWEPVRASRNALCSAWAFHNVPSPLSWQRDLRRRVSGWIRPHGMLIACLGPDATGKCDVVRALAQQPLAPFERVQTMRLHPCFARLTRRAAREDAVCKAGGRVGAAVHALLLAVDYWVGYWLRIRPNLVRSSLLVSDCYFEDVLAAARRCRMRSARTFARLLAAWVPQPSLWLVFAAPSAQHNGVCSKNLDRLPNEYRCALRACRNVVVLDASRSVDELLADAQREIIAQAARRTVRRLRLPTEASDNPLSAAVLLFFCRRNIPLLSPLVRLAFNSNIQCRIPSDIYLPHPYGVMIQAQAVIGRGVTVMQQAVIGVKYRGQSVAPLIEDGVYIGPGARILGDVRIGERAVICANALVTRDVPPGCTVVGANRIIAGQLALATKRGADGSIAHFPVGAHRAYR